MSSSEPDLVPRLDTEARPTTATARSWVPGSAVVAAVTAVATVLGSRLPVVGAPVFAIALGVLTAERLRRSAAVTESVDVAAGFAGRQLLQIAVVVMGTLLSLGEVTRVGASSLPVMLASLGVALGGGQILGRLLHVRRDTRTLVSVGTGICGASAIAAATAVIEAADADVAYAVATIFTFNVAAVLLFPALGHAFGLSQHAFGLWAGTAVNDTSSVVAAATVFGSGAAGYAVVVKLTRSLMIVPICIGLDVVRRRGRGESTSRQSARSRMLRWTRLVPPFLVGFVLASVANTVGLVPGSWHAGLTDAARVLITAALAGLGLTARPRELRAAGLRPLILGGLLWVAVAATSLAVQLG